MSIPPIGTNATTQASAVNDPNTLENPYLTAEGLLLYCQTQLGSIDGDIKSMMDEQLLNLNRKSALSKVEAEMKKYQPPTTEEALAKIDAAFQEAIASLPPGDPTRLDLEAQRTKCLGAVEATEFKGLFSELSAQLDLPKRYTISKDAWQGQMAEVSNMKEDVAGNAELTMIRLQSLISQRQTAVQLTTNMTAKLEQTEAAVVKNV